MEPLAQAEKEAMIKYNEERRNAKKDGDELIDGYEFENSKKDEVQFRFHPKTRIVDQITPEALILSLKSGDGILAIVSDEFKVRFVWYS